MLIRRAGAAVVIAATAMAGAHAWASRPQVAPTAQTAASFSLDVGAPRSVQAAAVVVARLRETGIAAYSRPMSARAGEQVMAGPYVSLDEAEAMQRRLRATGFGSSRLFVDDSLRRAPRNDAVADSLGTPGIVLAAAPGRLSLAVEMRSQPRQVTATRHDATTLHVDIGPLDGPIERQTWNAPAGAHLIRGVAVEEIASGAGLKYARATVIVPEFARANTRIEGRRVYVDLTWPGEELPARPAPARRATPPVAAPAPSRADAPRLEVAVAPAVEALDAVAARVERLLPFVQSAGQSPAPDVVAALRPMVDELAASLRQVPVSPGNAARHAQLTADVQRASALLQAVSRP